MNWRRTLIVLHDVLAAAVAWIAGFLLRFNFDVPADYLDRLIESIGPVVALQAIVFFAFGLYRGVWRFASLPDLRRILFAVGTCALATPTLLALLLRLPDVPRSVIVLDPILLFLFLSGSRILYRAWKEGHLVSLRALDTSPVLVLGAGRAAESLLRDLATSRQWRAVGLLEDLERRRGGMIQGVPVLGPIRDVARHAEKLRVRQVIVALPAARPADRRRAIEAATSAGLSVLTVPSLDELVSGRVEVSQVRRVDVEDLLGREQVKLDDQAIRGFLSGKIALITGAGGSIGAELCRQIARYEPARIVFFELNEFALYSIEEEFRAAYPAIPIVCAIGDVKDASRVESVIARHRPDVIFHAAAYKHVPLMEEENAWEAVRNNVGGTLVVAEAAIRHQVERFVFVSTDKAVNPVNVMGASKRLAEMVCQALQKDAGTRFVMVRFGNVLGSAGSVIPKFRKQIAQGGPVTVTHPDIKRYFMSIPEACQLVLQAGAMGSGGEIFVLDMGEPVRIADLARDMIRLSGFSEDDIRIEFTGLRPGEKLYEEVLANDETSLATPHPKLRIARARGTDDVARLDDVRDWMQRPAQASELIARLNLQRWVSEYAPALPADAKAPGIAVMPGEPTPAETSVSTGACHPAESRAPAASGR